MSVVAHSSSVSHANADHLETNDPSANYDHLLRHVLQLNCTRTCDHFFLIYVQARKWRGLASRCNDDVLRPQCLLISLYQVDLHLMLARESRRALNVFDVVFLEQKLDSLRQPVHRSVLRGHHLFQVELHFANFDASLFGVVQDLVVHVRVVEERF